MSTPSATYDPIEGIPRAVKRDLPQASGRRKLGAIRIRRLLVMAALVPVGVDAASRTWYCLPWLCWTRALTYSTRNGRSEFVSTRKREARYGRPREPEMVGADFPADEACDMRATGTVRHEPYGSRPRWQDGHALPASIREVGGSIEVTSTSGLGAGLGREGRHAILVSV
jgi:hypothetical protein